MIDSQTYYSHGKLLITGEYLVLLGAMALAIPVKYGQSLTVNTGIDKSQIIWIAKEMNKTWFEATLALNDLSVITSSDDEVGSRLQLLLRSARELNPAFLSKPVQVETDINFPRSWGLGTSSSLTANVATWAGVDPFQLNWKVSSGSGYDVACALHSLPIIYQVVDKIPKVEQVSFYPAFHEQLYFVYLGEKQDSAKSIADFFLVHQDWSESIRQISQITLDISRSTDLFSFMKLVEQHENILSLVLQVPTVKQTLFSDFKGAIKSLGAWGGDFILAASPSSPEDIFHYFQSRDYVVIYRFTDVFIHH